MGLLDWIRKKYLDEILNLGLKAQKFEFVGLEIGDQGKDEPFPVLLTKDFNSLCQEESMVIYNNKGRGEGRVIGNELNRDELINGLEKKDYAQGLLSEIIKEYAVCLTFGLPISVVNSYLDDSEHYCFKLPENLTLPLPPVAHYMFWDVVGDFYGLKLPYIVPTLAELKSGNKGDHSLDGLETLANQLACALMEVCGLGIGMPWERFDSKLQTPLLKALNDDDFLKSALEHARTVVVNQLNNKLNERESQQIESKEAINLILSTNNLDLVKRAYSLYSNVDKLHKEHVQQIKSFSKKYNDMSIMNYLESNLEAPFNEMQLKETEAKLKKQFLETYEKTLNSDRASWCGLYSFFARSNIEDKNSLQDLVNHAQGQSTKGSGARSRSVMYSLGWLDNSNKVVNEDLESVLNSYRN